MLGVSQFVELKFVFHFAVQLPPFAGTVLCGPRAADDLLDGKLGLGGQASWKRCFPVHSYGWDKHSLFA